MSSRLNLALLAAGAACALMGCSTTPTDTDPNTKAKATTVEPAGVQPTLLASETGFTLNEPVQVPAEVRADYDSAMQLLAQKDYERGIALLVKITQSAPTATAPFIDLGIAYGQSGDLDKAKASLEKAVELNPRHPIAWNELGRIQRRKGEFAAARASYEKAIALVPDFHYARLNLAILCDLYLVDLTCALDNYTAYQQAMPEDKQAAMWIADLRTRTSR